MKKLFVLVALAGALVMIPRPSWADPKQDMQEAITRMQQGIPVLMRTIEVLGRNAPQFVELMQKAAVQAEKTGGPNVTLAPGQMPTADEMAQKIRGLQSLVDVMRGALPIVQQMQQELDPSRIMPHKAPTPGKYPYGASPYLSPPASHYNSVPKASPNAPTAPGGRTDPDLQI